MDFIIFKKIVFVITSKKRSFHCAYFGKKVSLRVKSEIKETIFHCLNCWESLDFYYFCTALAIFDLDGFVVNITSEVKKSYKCQEK